MPRTENASSIRVHFAGRLIAVAVGSLMLVPAGYIRPAIAADTISATSAKSTSSDESIRPFYIKVPQSQLDDLRKRISETRWPDKETR